MSNSQTSAKPKLLDQVRNSIRRRNYSYRNGSSVSSSSIRNAPANTSIPRIWAFLKSKHSSPGWPSTAMWPHPPITPAHTAYRSLNTAYWKLLLT